MRLTAKLVLGFLLCVFFAVGLSVYVGVRGEIARYESDLGQRHLVMGSVLRAAFSEVLDTDGETRAVSVLDYTDRRVRLVDIRWVHLEGDAPAERRPLTEPAKLGALHANRAVHVKDSGRLRTYVPVPLTARPLTALEFSEPLNEGRVVRSAVERGLRTLAAIALAVGVAAFVLGVWLVARPIRRLVDHARRIGNGDLSVLPTARRGDEIAQLGREMNAMCEQLATAQRSAIRAVEQLRYAEKLATVGKLASGLAHEIGTPLNVIGLRAKSIADGRAVGDGARDAGRAILEQANRVTSLVEQLLRFGRRRPPRRDRLELGELVRKTIELVDPIAAKGNATIVSHIGDPVHVRGDSGQLEQVVTNLFVNAIQAMPDGGTIEVGARVVVGRDAGRYVQLCVRDTGEGMTEDVLAHVFEPFFTTKQPGEGTGLGLAVCDGIVRDHGGYVEATSRIGEGSVLLVHLPAEDA